MKRNNSDWTDWLPWLFGGVAAAGAGVALWQSAEDEQEEPIQWYANATATPAYGGADANISTMRANLGPSIDSSVMARAPQVVRAIDVIGQIAIGNKGIFATPTMAKNLVFDKNLRSLPDPRVGRKQIVLQTHEDVRFFGSLMSVAWMLSQGDKKAQTLSFVILNWMYYHRWEVSPGLQEIVVSQIVNFSCKRDDRLPYYQKGAYPEVDMINPSNPAGTPIQVGGDRPVWPSFTRISTYAWRGREGGVYGACHEQDPLDVESKKRLASLALNRKDAPFFNWPTGEMVFPQLGPPGLLVEYAMARYMQFGLVSLLDPKAGEAIGTTLLTSMNSAIGIAATGAGAAIAAAAGASAAIPVAGLVTAAIGALVSLFIGIFGVTAAIERTREARMVICKQIANFLGAAWKQYGHAYPRTLTDYLSGYRADLLIPSDSWSGIAHYDDIKDPLYHNYALCSSTTVDVCPQLPFFYLNIEFPLPVSIAQPMNNWLCILPVLKNGIVVDWKKEEYPMPAYAKVVAEFIKTNPIMRA